MEDDKFGFYLNSIKKDYKIGTNSKIGGFTELPITFLQLAVSLYVLIECLLK